MAGEWVEGESQRLRRVVAETPRAWKPSDLIAMGIRAGLERAAEVLGSRRADCECGMVDGNDIAKEIRALTNPPPAAGQRGDE